MAIFENIDYHLKYHIRAKYTHVFWVKIFINRERESAKRTPSSNWLIDESFHCFVSFFLRFISFSFCFLFFFASHNHFGLGLKRRIPSARKQRIISLELNTKRSFAFSRQDDDDDDDVKCMYVRVFIECCSSCS